MICLINKSVLYFSHKANFHNCIEMKYNLDVIKCYVMLCYVMLCYVMLCYVRTSSLADIQALDLLLIHSQNVNWITTAQINPRHEKMQISFYINQFHLWNNSMFLETICFVLFCTRFFICIFIFFYLYIFILEMLGKLL